MLNPRETMFDCTMPPLEIDKPGCDLRWSVTVIAPARSAMRSTVTTEIAFGESSTFSGAAPRVPVIATGLSRAAASVSAKFTVDVVPLETVTPLTRRSA